MRPTAKLSKVDNTVKMLKDIKNLTALKVYVGIPDTDNRDKNLLNKLSKAKGKKQIAKLKKAVLGDVSNAELMYIHTNGSPLRNIPARPVIEPAIEASGNIDPIQEELKEAAKATLEEEKPRALRHLRRAGLMGQNAARGWFTDNRNGWAPNTPGTIAAKGSDKPLIDTADMRRSITYVVAEE